MTKHAVVLVAIAVLGCGSGATKDGGTTTVGNETTTGQSAASVTDEVVVVASIVGAGPIGDGACSQRSYEIAIATVESGGLPDPRPAWVHFEACGDARTTVTFSGTGLDIGATYRLALRRGASANFAGEYMIVDARTP